MKAFRAIAIVLIVMLGTVPTLSAQESTPTPAEQTSIIGDAWEFVPEGEPNEVSIVAHAGPHSSLGDISVLVRNNTDETISNIQIKSEFRDNTGKLMGVGDVTSFEPNIIEPGGIGFGLTMGANLSDPTLEITFKLSYDTGSGMVIGQNLEFVYSEWTGDRILGEFTNPTDSPMSVIHLSYACFTGDGEFMGVKWGSANGDLMPGETTTFQVADMDPDTASCEHHLVTGNGF